MTDDSMPVSRSHVVVVVVVSPYLFCLVYYYYYMFIINNLIKIIVYVCTKQATRCKKNFSM